MKKLLIVTALLLITIISVGQITYFDSVSLTRERWRDSMFRMDKSLVPSGFLLDYSGFGFQPTRFNGIGIDDDTIKSDGQIFSLHNILWNSRVNPNVSFVQTDSLFKAALNASDSNKVPLIFLLQKYDTIRSTALSQNLFYIDSDSIGILDVMPRSSSPYDSVFLFAFSPVTLSINQFGNIRFTLPSNLFLIPGLTSVEIDFDDGAGFRTLQKGGEISIYYQNIGIKTLKARIITSGTTLIAKTRLQYSRPLLYVTPNLATKIEVDPLYTSDSQYFGNNNNQNVIPCAGSSLMEQFFCSLKPSADVTVVNGCDNVFNKPIIIVEGFDPENSIGFDELVDRFSAASFMDNMRAYGYDFVFVDFNRNTTYIENNAKVLEAVINYVNQNKTGTFKSSIIGFSMGGLITRWCLKDMEDRSLSHNVEYYFSYDAPHQGANIPLGLQFLFKEIERDLPFLKWSKSFRQISDANNSPAARQMLVTKASYSGAFFTPSSNTLDDLRSEFASRLQTKGYPQQAINIGLAFGRGDNTNNSKDAGNGVQWNNFGPGSQILKANVTWVLTNFQSRAYAVQENNVKDFITKYRFEGLTFRRLFWVGPAVIPQLRIRVRNIEYTSINSYDEAPGGYELTQEIFASQISGLANGAAQDATTDGHLGHNFVATVSALDLKNQSYNSTNNWQSNNLFYNVDNQVQNAGQVAGNTISSNISPFQRVITSTTETPSLDLNLFHNRNITSTFSDFIQRNILNAIPVPCAGTNNLCNYQPLISGTNTLCSTATYTLSNYPNAATITWQLNNGNAIITAGQGTPSVTLTKVSNGSSTLSVTITTPCTNLTVNKTIQVGLTTPTFSVVALDGGYCQNDLFEAVGSSSGNGTVTYNWTVNGILESYNGFKLRRRFPSNNTTISLTVSNGCGTSNPYSETFNCESARFMLSPNPATSTVQLKGLDNATFRRIRIVDKLGNTKKDLQFPMNTKTATINISTLPMDIYNFQIFDGQKWTGLLLSIQN